MHARTSIVPCRREEGDQTHKAHHSGRAGSTTHVFGGGRVPQKPAGNCGCHVINCFSWFQLYSSGPLCDHRLHSGRRLPVTIDILSVLLLLLSNCHYIGLATLGKGSCVATVSCLLSLGATAAVALLCGSVHYKHVALLCGSVHYKHDRLRIHFN